MTPDSASVVFLVSCSGCPDRLEVSPISGGGSSALPVAGSGEYSPDFEIAEDSQHVVFETDGQRVFAQAFDGSAAVEKGSNSGNSILQWGISPDAARVIVLEISASTFTSLYSSPIAAGPPVKISSEAPRGTRIKDFAFSTASNFLVYRADDRVPGLEELFHTTLTTVGAVRLSPLQVTGFGGVATDYYVTADNARVIYRADTNETNLLELFSVPLAGGDSIRLNSDLAPGGIVVTSLPGPMHRQCSTSPAGTQQGGIWFDGNKVYDVDGIFILSLSDVYDDDRWKLYDDDGNVRITDTLDAFHAAARPDVDPEYQNHCVEGRMEWLENGEPVPTTVMIPTIPIVAESAGRSRGNLGVTLNGVVIAASAPVDAILGAYTIAPFDDCGGHINPFDGYHLHGARGCSETGTVGEGETPIFAYAMDGFPIHSPLEGGSAAEGLDECQGHTANALGYHYHAASAEENGVLRCFTGLTVQPRRGVGPPGEGPPGGGE